MQYDGRFHNETATRGPAAARQFWFGTVLGDFNGDGQFDLTGCGQCGVPEFVLNDGNGVFAAAPIPAPAVSGAWRVETAGIDGDGDLDLLYAGMPPPYGPATRIYVNDGSATFTDESAARLPGSQASLAIATGDIDGDGDLDLVVGRPRTIAVFQINDRGVYLDVSLTALTGISASAVSLAFAGVDGDGDLDIFGGSLAQDRLMLNDGTGTFTDVTASHLPVRVERTDDVQFEDLDNDGDPDLVVAHGGAVGPSCAGWVGGSGYFNYDVRVLINLAVQLEAPLLALTGEAYDFTVSTGGRGTIGSDTAVLALATGPAQIPAPGLGIVGLDPNQLFILSVFSVPRATGEATFVLQVPNASGLSGIDFYSQVIVLGPGQPPRLSNRLLDRVSE